MDVANVVNHVVTVVILIYSVLITLAFWARLRATEDDVSDLETKAPSKRLTEVESTCEALIQRVDSAMVDISSFKGKVKNEMQRFDQIMRRKEAAVKKLEAASEDQEEDDGFPDSIPADSSDGVLEKKGGSRYTRAELRQMWKDKHGGE